MGPGELDTLVQRIALYPDWRNITKVRDAVQRDRRAAFRSGYLRTNGSYAEVDSGRFIEINPVNHRMPAARRPEERRRP